MNGKKTMVYWIGLILLSAASVFLFGVFWMYMIFTRPSLHMYYLKSPLVPAIVGGVVFVFIGIFMMRAGVRRGEVVG